MGNDGTKNREKQQQQHTLKIHGTNFYWPCHDLHNPYFDKIHPSTDILITHCPVEHYVDNDRGCPTLHHVLHNGRRKSDFRSTEKDEKVTPQIVICGHEHLGTGIVTDEKLGVTFVNAANAKGGSRGGHTVGK